jgi:hypothetical protein
VRKTRKRYKEMIKIVETKIREKKRTLRRRKTVEGRRRRKYDIAGGRSRLPP